MTAVEALSTSDITKIGVGVIIALFVVGALLSLLITKLIARVVILVVVIALAVVVWQQRNSIKDQIDRCDLSVSFFGIHLDAPDDVKQRCRKIGS